MISTGCIDDVVLIPMKYSELLEIYMELDESKPRTYNDYDLDAAQRKNIGKYDYNDDTCDNSNAKLYMC